MGAGGGGKDSASHNFLTNRPPYLWASFIHPGKKGKSWRYGEKRYPAKNVFVVKFPGRTAQPAVWSDRLGSREGIEAALEIDSK